MSSSRDLEIRLGSLNEIKEIMSAMKNLSLMEVHKLGRFLENQRRVIDSIEAAAADLLAPGLRALRRALTRLVGVPIGLSGSGPSLWAPYPSVGGAGAFPLCGGERGTLAHLRAGQADLLFLADVGVLHATLSPPGTHFAAASLGKWPANSTRYR